MMRPHRCTSLLLLGGLAWLSACGGTPAPSGPPSAVVRGSVLFPPQAGTATLTSGAGARQVKVLTAEVDAGGGYLLTLPATLPDEVVSASPESGLPVTLWQSDRPLTCQGRPVLDHPAAHLLVVDGGFYSVGGKRVGELLPQSTALADDSGTVTTLKLLVYADRSATVQGTLKCSVGGRDVSAARVTLDYRFKRGWNMVVVRSELAATSTELDIRGSVSLPQGPSWKFLPTLRCRPALPSGP
ncbi:hypothetical protein [Deinococcus wulumuqiensis]|uniref:hypothetical protein n=1 Tax=Deinococcus wulumuqiensis TaxID=980427 RepID=UPI00034ADC9B|nr:hypothetical protein [Deinococcus wulumuqiensis]